MNTKGTWRIVRAQGQIMFLARSSDDFKTLYWTDNPMFSVPFPSRESAGEWLTKEAEKGQIDIDTCNFAFFPDQIMPDDPTFNQPLETSSLKALRQRIQRHEATYEKMDAEAKSSKDHEAVQDFKEVIEAAERVYQAEKIATICNRIYSALNSPMVQDTLKRAVQRTTEETQLAKNALDDIQRYNTPEKPASPEKYEEILHYNQRYEKHKGYRNEAEGAVDCLTESRHLIHSIFDHFKRISAQYEPVAAEETE